MAKRAKKTKPPAGSLLSPEAMGGIIAGKGLDFQTRYAVCHLPTWLEHGAFHQLFFEGTGDIDVRFIEGAQSSRVHVQVKDHEVGLAELKKALDHFRKIDADSPGVYQKFTLACPSLSASLRSIESGLARLRNAKPFYDDKPSALLASKEDFLQRLDRGKLSAYADFIEAKVFIELGHEGMGTDARALEIFVARILNHPSYKDRVRAMVEPAFSHLMRSVAAGRGTVLDRTALLAMVEAAIAKGAADNAITLSIQSWIKEVPQPPPDYVLDWSEHFDRSTRRVPDPKTWEEKLVPQLKRLHGEILEKRKERLIRFAGKCPLSTGLLLGAAFPMVGGWTFEMAQPPAPGAWRSDAVPASPYQVETEIIDGDPQGKDLVLGLNIKGNGRTDVIRYIEETGQVPRAFMFVSPTSQGVGAIADAAEAVAFARAVADQLGPKLKAHNLRATRLFFYGPLALAVFLGQHLTSIGEVQLFEYQDPGYVPSCRFRT